MLKLREGERLESVKDKIQKILDLPDKEFEKYRVAVVSMGRAKYVDDGQDNEVVRIRDFQIAGQSSPSAKPYIGLEHVNKNSKRARYNYMEKAIKIYN
jgi:ubiquitin carboxyl-terminal hydrolase 7